MHVVQFIDNLISAGTTTVVLQLCSILAARGHDNTVVTANAAHHHDSEIIAKLRDLGCATVHLGWEGQPYDFFSFLRLVWRGRICFRSLKADVIHVHSYYSEQVLNIGFPLGIPALVTLHTDSRVFGSQKPQHKLRDFLAGRFYLKDTTRLVAVSSYLEGRVRMTFALGDKPIERLWNSVSPEWMEDDVPPERDLDVVQVARADGNKNHSVVVEALAILAQRGRKVTAVLGGGGPNLHQIRRQVADYGLTGTVLCPGTVYNPRALLRRARIVVAPSRCEAFSLVPIEGLASGCACICSDIPAHREILAGGQFGVLVDADDAASWADSIEHLLRAETERLALAARGRRWVERSFSFAQWSARYMAIYQELSTRASVRVPRRTIVR